MESWNCTQQTDCYQLAASQRHAHAIFNLGLMYEMGDYVLKIFT